MAACLSLMLILSGCGSTSSSTSSSSQKAAASSSGAAAVSQVADNDKALHVTMLDVAQADATLIQYKGQNMLIDMGDMETRDSLVQQLKAHNVKTLDIVVITHPHGDHMGGMSALFKNFTIKQIYDNGQAANTAMYRNYLKNIKAKNIAYKALKKGDTITLADDIHFDVLSPDTIFTKDNTDGISESGLTNNNSLVCKMTYGNFSIMFTGDAQKEAEAQILRSYKGAELKSDIIKVGHHGSKTSSSPAFIKAVAPKAATISCGQGNKYKFPHEPTLNTLKANNVEVYRTDRNGSITIISDGTNYSIQTAR